MATDAAPLPPHPKPIIVFDDSCSFCTRSMRMARAIDRFHRFDQLGWHVSQAMDPPLVAGEAGEGLRVVHKCGDVSLGINAVRSILVRTPLAPAGWLLYLPGIHGIGKIIYGAIARRRMRLSCVRQDLPPTR